MLIVDIDLHRIVFGLCSKWSDPTGGLKVQADVCIVVPSQFKVLYELRVRLTDEVCGPATFEHIEVNLDTTVIDWDSFFVQLVACSDDRRKMFLLMQRQSKVWYLVARADVDPYR